MRGRHGDHPKCHLAQWSGVRQLDAYAGHNDLYARNRELGPIFEASCFAHAKSTRGEKVGLAYPIVLEAVQKPDTLFAIERDINRRSSTERPGLRQEFSAPLMAELHTWLTFRLSRISRNHDLAKAINYMSGFGRSSPLFSPMAGPACRTSLLNGPFAACYRGSNRGCFVAQIEAGSARPWPTRLSIPAASTLSIARLGLPKSRPVSPTIPPAVSTNSCLETCGDLDSLWQHEGRS